MKILLVSPLPPPAGGIATWTEKYLSYCKNNSVDVSIVNIALSGSRGKQINTKKNVFDEISRTKRILYNLKSQIKINTPDIVHLNTSCSKYGLFRDFLCAAFLKKKNIPFILQCHCDVKNHIRNRFSELFLKKMVKSAGVVLLLNSRSKEYIESLCSTECKVIPNFVEETMIFPCYKVREKIRNAVYVGHVNKSKGCLEIIEAAKRLPECHFILVGPVSAEIEAIDKPNNVEMTGAKTPCEVKKYLREADVFVFPSYSEGFSLSLTEAMATGLPCIVTEVGANKDMIEDAGGIVVGLKNVTAILEAFEVMSSLEIRKRMSVFNIEKVRNSYTTDVVMKEIFCMYRNVIG